MVDRDDLIYLFHSLFCFTGGNYKEGPGDIWEVKGEIPDNDLPMLVKLTPLHFALNT